MNNYTKIKKVANEIKIQRLLSNIEQQILFIKFHQPYLLVLPKHQSLQK